MSSELKIFKSISVIFTLVTLVFIGLYFHQQSVNSKLNDQVKLLQGGLTAANLSPSLAKQISNDSQVAGAFPVPMSGTNNSCNNGQVLSFVNGKVICVSLQSNTSGQITVTKVGPPGPKGATGNNGSTGANGSSGTNGTNGVNGTNGNNGVNGANGSVGATGVQGTRGNIGPAGPMGPQGIQGAIGPIGPSGLLSSTATGLAYNSNTQNLALAAGYQIPLSSSISNWNEAYSWGNPALAGYAVQSGQAGGQTIVGGINANNALNLQGNSATSGNTATDSAISLKVGNGGNTDALTILNNGNVGIGTVNPGSSLTIAGNVAVTTTGSNNITPFQFVQVTGLGDDANVTSFNGVTYPVSSWNAAVVGFANGGSCGVDWSSSSPNGFQYWWTDSGGDWKLTTDISGPNDGCEQVQVMFVRREFSSRINYGY